METSSMLTNRANGQSIVAVASNETADENEDGDDEEEKENVPDLGGTKRLAAEYAQEFQCTFYLSLILSLIGGGLECSVWAYLFPESLEILSNPNDPDFNQDLMVMILEFV